MIILVPQSKFPDINISQIYTLLTFPISSDLFPLNSQIVSRDRYVSRKLHSTEVDILIENNFGDCQNHNSTTTQTQDNPKTT